MSTTPTQKGSRQNSIMISKPKIATAEVSYQACPSDNFNSPNSSSPATPIASQPSKVTGLLQKSLLLSRDTIMSSNEYDHVHKPVILPSRPTINRTMTPVKETSKILLEYDPITKRKILNTYEILKQIGKGEHGKVKLAKDLVHKDLVAIKIVNRKNKRDRPQLRMRKSTKAENDYELKIKREIAIMKRCKHKHIVELREVLDDVNTHKIYMVLEYLEKGEVKWKRTPNCSPNLKNDDIPFEGSQTKLELDLLSNDYSPNLTFKQLRKVFRDVLLGLEYLHLQGIVHRDIKPANLLVSSDNTVKISDFGVSFASSLDEADEGLINELELAKTAGTPAFFAPELCQTNFSSNNSNPPSRKNSSTNSVNSLEALRNDLTLTKILPRIDYKIDIWALGVTFYCLLFGKLPFNADSEFDLFQVIVNQPLEFPPDKDSFNSPDLVTETEFELAKDLLNKLLDKNSETRIDINSIKSHPFVLYGLDNDLDALNDLIYLNNPTSNPDFLSNLDLDKVTKDEIDNAVIGVGSRIKRSILRAITSGSKDHIIRKKILATMENSSSMNSSSDESQLNHNFDPSVILSESQGIAPSSGPSTSKLFHHESSRNSSSTLAGIKDGRFLNALLNDVIEANKSNSSSRRGSITAGANEIETKRNVAGDLYLKNQSVVDTFKGIQQLDDKRRRSSVVSGPSAGSAKNSVSHDVTQSPRVQSPQFHSPPLGSGNFWSDNYNPTPDTINPVSIPGAKASQILIGPISEDRKPESVISLPLTESFASLDSINDEYLSLKYKEYSKSKYHKHHEGDHHSHKHDVTDDINEKFQNFNLGNLMNSNGISFNFAKRGNNSDEIAPKTILNLSSSSCSSSSGSSSSSTSQVRINVERAESSGSNSSSGSESDSDNSSDEDGNLTLAFSSRVTPSAPRFLSMDQRAKSHDSSLPSIKRTPKTSARQVPIVLPQNQPELEDIPAALMSSVPRPSVSIVPGIRTSPTSTKSDMSPVNVMSEKVERKDSRRPSPLINNAPFSENATTNSHLTGNLLSNPPSPGKFNNHYKKEPIVSPFPKAIHNETDRETKNKLVEREEIKNTPQRPLHYRSNSITIGLLQHPN